MNIVTLNTEDYRCPEVMIKARRFLSTKLTDSNLCEVITIEPSSMRDIPFYCSREGFHVVEKQSREDGTFRFLISKTETQTNYDNAVVQVVNVNEDKVARDKHLFNAYESVVSELYMLLEAGVLLTIPCSFGKDSKLVLTAALDAHQRAIKAGVIEQDHPFIVIHIDTGIESIPMLMYSLFAMKRLECFCSDNNINLSLHHQRPDLQFQFASLFLGARKLPSTPMLNSDCAVIMKIDVSQAIQKKLIAKYGKEKLVSCIGSRHDEGTNRSQSLKKFGNDKMTATSLIKENEKGISTFAPIRDLSNEEVFEMLQRMGTDPMIAPAPGLKMSSYMSSYRLLIQIYGDSANDTCEINMGDSSQKTACGGSARNGCLNCFKAGKVDKSVVAHNRYERWAQIQANANKVRDYMYSVAHDVNHRTHHPRAFDPVTNHAMLQPNILSSRTLERLLTYFVQLTDDDLKRATRFNALKDAGQLESDPGYQDIMSDNAFFDEKTKQEFIEMYTFGASQHLIQTATIEHCLYLSAQWAMDGVKSLPFRPLAIYDSVVRKGRRIPYPNVDTQEAPNDNIGDAMAIKLSETGIDLLSLHTAPFRSWDVVEADMRENCSTISNPNMLRVSVTYSTMNDKEIFRVVHNGVTMNVGDHTRKALLEKARERFSLSDGKAPITFSQFLTFREMTTVGKQLRATSVQKRPIFNATRRAMKRLAGGIKRTKTSLNMYQAPLHSSLSVANLKDVRIWVPNMEVENVPFIAQHQQDINEVSVNFKINDDLDQWFDYGGYDKAIALHDEYLRRARQERYFEDGKYTLRRFRTTEAFWMLVQDGVISVNSNTWYTAQRTLQRTEIFLEAGLFNLPNNSAELASRDFVVSMTEHRSIKATALLAVRAKRNADRAYTRALLNGDMVKVEKSISDRFEKLSGIRNSIVSPNYIAQKLLIAGGVTGFDSKNFTAFKQLADDWLQEFGSYFEDVDAMLKLLCSSREIEFVNSDLNTKIALSNTLSAFNTEYEGRLKAALTEWSAVVEVVKASEIVNEDRIFNESLLKKMKSVMPGSDDISVSISLEFLADTLTFNKCSMMSMFEDEKRTLDNDWHQPKIDSFKEAFEEVKALTKRREVKKDTLGEISSSARNNVLMELF